MIINTLSTNVINTKNMQNKKNVNQSFGSHLGVNSNSSYNNYQVNTIKQKESIWQKRNKFIKNSIVVIGIGILGIVLYNKRRFGKTKNVISSNNFSPLKNNLEISLKTLGNSFATPKNDLETSLKILGLSEETIIGGVKIANLMKTPESVSKNQFVEVAQKVQEKIKSKALSNELSKAAVIILEQLRKNLQKSVSKIKNFDLNNEIKDINVLSEILKEAEIEPVEKKPEIANEKLQQEFLDLLCCAQDCNNVENINKLFNFCQDKPNLIAENIKSVSDILISAIENNIFSKKGLNGDLQQHFGTFFDVCQNQEGVINENNAAHIANVLWKDIKLNVYGQEQKNKLQQHIDTFFNACQNQEGVINKDNAAYIALILRKAIKLNVYGQEQKNKLQQHIDTFFNACEKDNDVLNNISAGYISILLITAMDHKVYKNTPDPEEKISKYMDIFFNACKKANIKGMSNYQVKIFNSFFHMDLSEKVSKDNDVHSQHEGSSNLQITEEQFIKENGLPQKDLNEYYKNELICYINTFFKRINVSDKISKGCNFNEKQLLKIAKSIYNHITFITKNLPILPKKYDINTCKFGYKPTNTHWLYSIYSDDIFNCNSHGCWKMHIYIEDENDYQKIAPIILEYLKNNPTKHKTFHLLSPELFKITEPDQGKKGIVIYPKYDSENKSNIKSMEKIARDLDKLIRDNDLTTKESLITGDAKMGTTGRLFYRYEFNSIKDCNERYNGDEYKRFYVENRTNIIFYKDENNKTGPYKLEYPYLPKDGQDPEKYDPWYRFDPADPNSNPNINKS